ncbi:helix-turn-helix domain-containing protein [Ruminococcaceae bacterium OttesenSCG-928-O06]|nr:helix-turn-helix domain-containing protein [Ruminococcaceae bacterium OttesenSCG-928-O06]
MTQNAEMYNTLPNVLNAAQLADTLGISRAGAYNLLNRKDFPTLRIGSRKLVSKHHLAEWIEQQVASHGGKHV